MSSIESYTVQVTCHLVCWLLNWLNHWMSKCLHQSIYEPIMTNQAKFNVFHGPKALPSWLLHLVHLQNPSQMSLLRMLCYHFQKSSIRLSCYRMHTTKLTLSSRMSCVCHFVWRIARVESSIAKWIYHKCLFIVLPLMTKVDHRMLLIWVFHTMMIPLPNDEIDTLANPVLLPVTARIDWST